MTTVINYFNTINTRQICLNIDYDIEYTELTIHNYKCTNCGHSWFPRGTNTPNQCPRCKVYDWDKPREKMSTKKYTRS